MNFNILTFHRAYNYGAVLQAFALQEFISNMGYSCGVYDYIAPSENRLVGIKGKILQAVQQLNKKDCAIREAKYREFAETALHLNKEENSDIYVSGSDQVFNPCGAFDSHYFLQFAPEEALRISYAASMGEGTIPENRVDTLGKYVSGFDMISVREAYDKERLSPLCNQEIHIHVDPSMLHDKTFWRQHMEPVEGVPEKYILVYVLHRPKNINKLLKWLKKETGAKILVVDGQGVVQGVMTHLVKHDKALHRVGPREFLWLMDHAQCVVTSSFHGTAFSLLFEKEFYSLVNMVRPSRIKNILAKVGLQPVSEETETFRRQGAVNWAEVEHILQEERQRSRTYITQAYHMRKQA